jgi:cytochrome c oxidase assembly protein subunit 15
MVRKLMLLRGLAVAASVGMFLVLVMGATVTNTGSAQGCGQSWPLCNGRLVPEFTVATAIEYSHRAVTGVEGVLVGLLGVGVLVRARTREVWLLVGLMLGFLFLQAGLGAWAVMAPQSPLVLASHFGISLIAFASVFLTSVWVFQPRAPAAERAPGAYRWLVLATTVYVLGVVYLGAYVRHTGVGLACADWPLCNGQLWPGFSGAAGVVFAHRLAAVGVLVLLGCLAVWSRRLADARLAGASLAAFVLGLAQAASGAALVWTQLGLFSALSHAALVSLLFASLAFLVRRVGLPAATTPASGRARAAAAGARP